MLNFPSNPKGQDDKATILSMQGAGEVMGTDNLRSPQSRKYTQKRKQNSQSDGGQEDLPSPEMSKAKLDEAWSTPG